MRVFGLLVVLLLAGAALFLFWPGGQEKASEPQLTLDVKIPAKQSTSKLGGKSKAVSSADKSENAKAGNEDAASLQKSAESQQVSQAASQPVIIEKKDLAENQDDSSARSKPAMAIPSFDVVRVDANCGLLVAGRAEPTATVQIHGGDTVLGSATADHRGEWVYISSGPLPAGAITVNVTAINPNGEKTETARLVVMQVPDCSKTIEERAPAIALLAPKNEKTGKIEKRVTKLLQMPEPHGDLKAAKNLAVGSIDYDDTGKVALSGKGTPGNDVQVYVDNQSVGSATVDNKGNWTMSPDQQIPEGTYTLRTDQLSPKGTVISRVEIPFQRASADDVVLAKGGLEIRAIVQPGNSLWRIARRMYGEGTEYTVIYQANQKQIKDPDLIFPGQIFKLPSEKVPN